MRPSIGRIVVYRRAEQLVPAVITQVITDERVNLCVFTNDAVSTVTVLEVGFGDEAGQWRWPERVS